MINYQNLNIEYDSVIVFDLLSPVEREIHKISSSLEELFKNNHIDIIVKYLNNKEEILGALEEILALAKTGKRFIFHFVGHGDRDRLGFKHINEFITWHELSPVLAEINESTRNTLILNMTSCFGVHGIKTVNPLSIDIPFFGIIGYSQELGIEAAKQANDIFYSSIFNGMQINQAVNELKTKMNDNNFHCISSQGYSHLKKIQL